MPYIFLIGDCPDDPKLRSTIGHSCRQHVGLPAGGTDGTDNESLTAGTSQGEAERSVTEIMRRLFKLVFFLAILGFAALAAYSYLVDLEPVRSERNIPVTLDAQ